MSRDIITKPCIVGGMDEDWYHSDFGPVPEGSLSSSGAKLLLPPNCPAIFEHQRRHPSAPSTEMETGTIVHGILLGTGQPAEVLDYPNYTTKAAREARDKARDAGRVPVLLHKWAEAEAIARAVMDDDECGGLLAQGDREQSMFAVDPEFGIWLRGRMDSYTLFGEVPTIVDLKTTADSSPQKFAKSIAEYRYDIQDWWYRELLAILLGCQPEDVDFVIVAVPVSRPYLPMAYRIEDERDIANARADCRIAREKYRDCAGAGVWPKWAADITPLSLPGYARKRIEEGINDYFN